MDPPKSTGKPTVLRPGVGTGRPAGFKPGAEAAYWIWQGPRGGWRIKTTTKDALHLFRGRFDATTGPISSVEPSRTEFRDRVWKTREGWAFSFKTQGHADGLIFNTRDNGCVSFDLQLDGGPTPKHIFVGRGEVEPGSSYFVVCPKGKRASLSRPLPRR